MFSLKNKMSQVGSYKILGLFALDYTTLFSVSTLKQKDYVGLSIAYVTISDILHYGNLSNVHVPV